MHITCIYVLDEQDPDFLAIINRAAAYLQPFTLIFSFLYISANHHICFTSFYLYCFYHYTSYLLLDTLFLYQQKPFSSIYFNSDKMTKTQTHSYIFVISMFETTLLPLSVKFAT